MEAFIPILGRLVPRIGLVQTPITANVIALESREAGLPGGWSQAVSEEMRKDIEEIAKQNIEFGEFSLQLFADVVLANAKTKVS